MKKLYEDIDFSKVDLYREKLKGFPEVILCEGKKPSQIIGIAKVLVKNKQKVLATRASKRVFNEVKKQLKNAKYHEDARLITIGKKGKTGKKKILVMSGGTADIPVAEEAAITAEFMGNKVERMYDVGIAGLHRLLKNTKRIRSANVIIAVAGMEGALPSVVSAITSKPVIAVPAKIGYGANFRGIAPLLTMLNSCSPGIAVMNVNNGFGAGYFAGMINR